METTVLSALRSKDSLIFSFVGFETQTVAVGYHVVINVKLKPNMQQLEAVEITALGVTRQSREVGYATQKVDGEDILKSNTSNVISAISGKPVGVQVSNSNGVDGCTTRIVMGQIRNLFRCAKGFSLGQQDYGSLRSP